MNYKKAGRQSNYELMRIISMFMIVLWHVLTNFVNMDTINNTSVLLQNLICVIIVIHVNSFILITGYFQSKSQFHLKKVFNLIGLSWFYRIATLIFVLGFSLVTLSNLEIINSIFVLPMGHEHWFIHYYILLYLLSPFLNVFINRTNQDEMKKLLVILIIINCLLPYLTNQQFFTSDNGYSLLHFITLYFIGAYFRKYPIKTSYHFKNLNMKKFRFLLIFVFFGCAFVNLAILYFGNYISGIASGPGSVLYEIGRVLQSHLGTYDFPITVLQSCVYVLFFGTFTFRNKFINMLSSTMIGVYLIHECELLKPILHRYLMINVNDYSNIDFVLQVLIVSLIIFAGSIFIEFIRKLLILFLKKTFIFLRKVLCSRRMLI